MKGHASSKKPGVKARRVFVIGGGLAGMTVAKELAKHHLQVVLLEAAPQLGGKAGSSRHDGRWEDHGYHLFPGWYVNVRALLQEIGCTQNLIDMHEFRALHKGDYPRFITTREVGSLADALHNLFAGVLPWHDNVLSYYYLMDLAAEPFTSRAFLDRVSALGFLRSRFYANEKLAQYHHQTVLQAVSVPYYDCSAMTLRKLGRLWIKTPTPLCSILNGTLYDTFIGPYRKRLEDLKVDIRCKQRVRRLVMQQQRIVGVVLDDGTTLGSADDAFVLAVPYGIVLQIVDAGVLQAEIRTGVDGGDSDDRFGLAGLTNLRSAPMAALHVRLKRKLRGIPKQHIVFLGSRFNLSVIDVSPHWGLEHTVLNLIASNFEPLRHLSAMEVKQFLIDELLEFLPVIRRADLPDDLGFLQSHLEQPLFLNTTAAWHYRPATTTSVSNLFVAGDYCRTVVDLATMEGAVTSGLNTAGTVLEWAGVAAAVNPLPLAEAHWLLLQAAKYATLPFIVPLALAKRAPDELRRWWDTVRGG